MASIREAKPEDVPNLLVLLKQHAESNNNTGIFQTTESRLSSHLSFDDFLSTSSSSNDASSVPKPFHARAMILSQPTEDKKESMIGYGLYTAMYNSYTGLPLLYLEDLFVKPEFRKQGYGKKMMQRLGREAQAVSGGESNGQGRIDWICFSTNPNGVKFYQDAVGAEVDQDDLKSGTKRIRFTLQGERMIKFLSS